MLNRGIKDAQSVREFLYGSAEPYHDPFLMKDMPKAAERIWRGIDAGERITVSAPLPEDMAAILDGTNERT